MQDPTDSIPQAARREAWNKGKLIGAKPPLPPKHVWSIRSKLQIAGRRRDLAMFNLAIDSKLRGCDVVRLKVEDVVSHGHAVDRATVRQKKTGQPVKFEMTEQTREAIDSYIAAAHRKPGEFLFAGRRGPGRPITTDSMPGWSVNGLQTLGWTRASLGRIGYAEPRPLSFTGICEQYSFCWGTKTTQAEQTCSAPLFLSGQ